MSDPPRRFCATPGCGATVAGRGHCPTHARARDEGRHNADMRRLYVSARWRRLRAQVLRDQPLCQTCENEKRLETSTDVDHVVPHRGDLALFWSYENLTGLCHACHSRKTQRGG